ncbi:lipopolysaccharide biosynthesis protein [Bradyrhizobium sp. CCBAU 45384]|uniref:lipopolysaccharide biosynthesis protein n=1 Tax=Bradyrhizobium sp. CCBAU 45384 TaxID=858428 RepID=UPI0023069A6C|nr:lipopolysaccharide biosynthesis protein [Bradyrhizobium sp. CCBAU 45384]MDA9405938.1 hypothetical protein [Bradyrhizobium sp. CCBAU 45384]
MALKHLALGAAMLSVSNIIRLLLQFVTLPVLARFLTPDEYGIVGIAMPFILFAQIFSDGGVAQSLVRENNDGGVAWSSVFWIITAIGCVAALLLIATAPVVAIEFGEPTLRPVIGTLGIVCIAQALTVVPSASLQRAHRFSSLALADISAAILGAAIAVALAVNQFGPWALVGQQLAVWLSKAVLVWAIAGFRPKLVLRLAATEAHLRFSRDVITFGVINFFARALDPLVIGKTFGASVVGTYSIASQLMRLPAMIVTGPIQSVFYTHVTRRKAQKKQLKTALLLTSRLIAIGVFPFMGLIAAGHEPLFRLLLSEKWAASGTIFMLFAAVGSVQAVTGLNGGILMATNRTGTQIRFTTEFTTIWLVTLLVAVRLGVAWIPVAYTVSWFLYFPRFARMFLSGIDCSTIEYVSTMALPALATIGSVALYLGVVNSCSLSDLEKLALVSALVLLAIALGGLLQANRIRGELQDLERS